MRKSDDKTTMVIVLKSGAILRFKVDSFSITKNTATNEITSLTREGMVNENLMYINLSEIAALYEE